MLVLSVLISTDVPVAVQRLMLKDQHLEDERSAQDYHIRRETELTILIKVPDGNHAMMPEVWEQLNTVLNPCENTARS